MTWVKVCGLRRAAEVAAAVQAGADAIGFNIAPTSPRFVAPATIEELARGLPALAILVTVDVEPAELLATVAATGVNGVQPHGRHSAAAARAAEDAGLFVLRPVPVAATVDISGVPAGQTPLLDTARPGLHGGTGERFDWTLAQDVGRDFVLAGGLDPGNVAAAIAAVRPWGVDASSGLESVPGSKDPAKIVAFVEEAKRT